MNEQKSKFIYWLIGQGACVAALNWVRVALDNGATVPELWQKCERAEWMLWLMRKCGDIERDVAAQIALEIARAIWELMPPAGRCAIEMAEAYLRGDAGIDIGRVDSAADAAALVARRATDNATVNAAKAAAMTATVATRTSRVRAVFDAAFDVELVANRVDRAVSEAAAYGETDVCAAARRKCADIVRQHIPEMPDIDLEADDDDVPPF